MQSSGGQANRNCVSCGRSIAFDANVCPYCGHDYRPQAMAPTRQKSDSALPVVGGVLMLIGSLIYIVVGGIVAAGSTVALGVTLGESAWGVACGLLILLVGVISLLGGVFAIQKKYWVITIIGGIFVIPTIIGLVGLILVAVSREAFES